MTDPQQKRLKLAFIGLCVMGYPMAGYLARAESVKYVQPIKQSGAKAE